MTRSTTLSSRPPLDALLEISGLPVALARFVKYEFDKHLYYYGAHFSAGYDRTVLGRNPEQYQAELLRLYWKLQPTVQAELTQKHFPTDRVPCLFSNAYFGWERSFADLGVRLVRSVWTEADSGNVLAAALNNQCRAVNELFRSGMSIFYQRAFHDILRSIADNLEQYYAGHPSAGLMLPFTNGFFEGLSSDIFRRLGKPVFLCIHGLPARFDWWIRGEHPIDYIVVWGEAMKRRIVATGRDPATVLTSGHPTYSGRPFLPITSKLDRVLVLGFPQNGAPLLDTPHYHDRSLALDYVWRVQATLKQLGVTRARLRPHPSESTAWYRSQIDPSFFELDEVQVCAESLKASTLVIGPTSTVLLDSLVLGINYVTFWPAFRHYNPTGDVAFDPDLPFDGSDARFPVARDETQLLRLLRKRATVDGRALTDYIGETFRPEVIVATINNGKSRSTRRPVSNTGPTTSAPSDQIGAPCGTAAATELSAVAGFQASEAIPETADVPPKKFELDVLHAVRSYTMTPPQVTLNAMRAVEFIEKRAVPGAVVECGVWRGGVSMAMMLQLKQLGSKRLVFMYDTFDGMSDPTEKDVSPTGESAGRLLAEHRKDESNHYWAFAPIERVRCNVESVGYPMGLVRMVQGKVEDTIPGVIPDQIALLRLDTDWYESTHHELIHLYDRLVSGGVMILDDYGFWQGARKAVDEFFATLAAKPELHVVHDQLNSCVRWCVKP